MMRLIADMMNRTERRVELEGRFPHPMTMVVNVFRFPKALLFQHV